MIHDERPPEELAAQVMGLESIGSSGWRRVSLGCGRRHWRTGKTNFRAVSTASEPKNHT
jgi:hypothetical protein